MTIEQAQVTAPDDGGCDNINPLETMLGDGDDQFRRVGTCGLRGSLEIDGYVVHQFVGVETDGYEIIPVRSRDVTTYIGATAREAVFN